MKRSLIFIIGLILLVGCSSSVDIEGKKVTYEELQEENKQSESDLQEIESAISKSESELETLTEKEKELVDSIEKSTRLNSSHVAISYAVFCLKKKKKKD